MKKIILTLAIIAAISAPAAAFASQTVLTAENAAQKQQVTRQYQVNNHEYRQQLWLDSSPEVHSNEPQLWL
jgi:type II secretory pathway pseudopilin PulG